MALDSKTVALSTNLMCRAPLTLEVNFFFVEVKESSSVDKTWVSELRTPGLLELGMIVEFSM